VPGLSPLSFSDAALKKLKSRKSPVNSWFLDLNLITDYWSGSEKRSYHHTAPVNSIYGLHEALIILKEEGLERSWDRHRQNHVLLRDYLEGIGLRFIVDEPYRLPQLNAVGVPDSVDEAAIRKSLLNDFDLEIGAGLGSLAGKIWRIGLMGYASNKGNVLYFVNALKEELSKNS
jgi:alanine-glyoxylate transaminase/serine-glyoxylate transaminase/serine-pyruvate transaminase